MDNPLKTNFVIEELEKKLIMITDLPFFYPNDLKYEVPPPKDLVPHLFQNLFAAGFWKLYEFCVWGIKNLLKLTWDLSKPSHDFPQNLKKNENNILSTLQSPIFVLEFKVTPWIRWWLGKSRILHIIFFLAPFSITKYNWNNFMFNLFRKSR